MGVEVAALARGFPLRFGLRLRRVQLLHSG